MFNYKPELVQYNAFCDLPLTKLIINAWGDVSMCCHHPGSAQIGNIKNVKDILEIWNSPIAKEVRRVTLTGTFHKHCAMARDCPLQHRDKIPYPIVAYKDFAHPTHIEIDLPDRHCNIGGETPNEQNPACIMCIRSFKDPTNQPDITDMICEKSKSLIPFLTKFSVLGVAEPFWKGAVFDIFKKVDFHKYNDNISFETNHNVTCFGERTQHRFLDEVKHSILQFSLDAGSAETYKKIRRLDAYDLVIKNLTLWMKNRTFPNHKVVIWNNINMFNVHEMTEMVETAARLNVDKIIMLPTHSQNGVVNLGDLTLNRKNAGIFQANAEKAMLRSQKLGVLLEYPAPFNIPTPPLVQIKL